MRIVPQSVVVALFTGLLATTVALAHGYHSKSIRIEHPWARPTPPNATTAVVYITLINEGSEPDRLLSAETSAAEQVEFHLTAQEEGVATMRSLAAVDLPPGTPIKAEPGGLHLMLVGLKTTLMEETLFPLTLVFERAGKMEIEVYVEDPPASTPHQGH